MKGIVCFPFLSPQSKLEMSFSSLLQALLSQQGLNGHYEFFMQYFIIADSVM